MNTNIEFLTADEKSIAINLTGIIDETVRFPIDHDFSEAEVLEIDFSKVRFFNSGGIKSWVVFSDYLGKQENLQVSFLNCNRMIIDQVNRTLGFLPKNGQVTSVLIPIFCKQCSKTYESQQSSANLKGHTSDIIKQAGDTHCGSFPECQKKWELDFHPAEFFKFLEKTTS